MKKNSKPAKECRSKAYSRGGLWICAALWRTDELTDTEKCLIALIDGLTNGRQTCELTDNEIARMMRLTRMRSDALLKSLEERRYVLRLWIVDTKGFVCRVAHPDVSSKPATARKWIKAYCYERMGDDEESAHFSRSPLPLALPS
jgi:hypothetical protein